MESEIFIRPYQERDRVAVARLIVQIQHDEFGIDISLNDQPDLLNINEFYQSKNGNFWCAINAYDEIVGTIALIDIDGRIGVIRKMFVHKEYRGKEKNIAKMLLDGLENWARKKHLAFLYLGTIDKFKAAQKFYFNNGYKMIDPDLLPPAFPRMRVDNLFFFKAFPARFGDDDGLLR